MTNIENEGPQELTLKIFIIKLKEWFSYILSKWIFIVAAGLLGGGIGYVYAHFKMPTYKAVLSFALEDENSGGSSLNGLASQFGFDVGGGAGGAFTSSNLAELMKSRSLVEKALLRPAKFDKQNISFVEYFIAFNNLNQNWKEEGLEGMRFLPDADRQKFTRQQDSVLGAIYAALTEKDLKIASRDKKVNIIDIELTSPDEKFAKYFVETLASEVSQFYVDTKSKKARINVAILQAQTDSIRSELNSAISGVASANDNTYNLNPARNIQRVASTRRQIDVQSNTVMLTQLIQNLEIAKVSLRKETPLIQVIDGPILPLEKKRLGRLRNMVLVGFLAGFFMVGYFSLRNWLRILIKEK